MSDDVTDRNSSAVPVRRVRHRNGRRGWRFRRRAATGAAASVAAGGAIGAASTGLAGKLLAVGMVAVVSGGIVTAASPHPEQPAGVETWRATPRKEESVPVSPVALKKHAPKDETRAASITELPAPHWPKTASATVVLPDRAAANAKVAGLPVRVSRVKTTAKDGKAAERVERVTVKLHRQPAQAAGGLTLSVSDPDRRGGRVEVELDYSGFASAMGAGWASRLQLVQLPACVLNTPEKAQCRTPEPVAGHNDTKRQRLIARVDLPSSTSVADGSDADEPEPGDTSGEADGPEDPTSGTPGEEPAAPGDDPSTTPPAEGEDPPGEDGDGEPTPTTASDTPTAEPGGVSGGGASVGAQEEPPPLTVLAAVAGAQGPEGDFKASDLSPAGEWSAGGSSGDFSYSYPMAAPSVPGGLVPELALAYNSGSIDGKTAATNGQASWVGDGWDFAPGGFIERTYRACSEDEGGNEPDETADLCWYRDALTISVGGVSGELIKKSDGTWVATSDSGAKIERLTGADNGARSGEYWKVTTTDGTRYYLGRHQLPGWSSGDPVTNSVNTVPVFGNDSGEPCHATAFADSWCDQAWRWNLDLVIDPLGNAMTFHYNKESNAYTRGDVEGPKAYYTRASYLKRIDYGLRSSALFATPLGRAEFTVAERCIVTSTFDCSLANRTRGENARHWPDVPVDLECRTAPKTNCQAEWIQDGASGTWIPGSHTPAFFTTKRLTNVITKINSGGSWRTVDSWKLTQSFPGTGEGLAPPLWLNSVQRTGHAGTGDPIATPKITFEGALFDNRVDTSTDSAYMRYRVTGIDNGHGGHTGIEYRPAECTASNLPTPQSNTKACFPIKWSPWGEEEPITDWFHKHLVDTVVETDRTGGHLDDEGKSVTAPIHTRYEYLGGAAWAFDTNDTTDKADRTWSVWRGYGRVRTLAGDPTVGDEQIVTEAVFARGMHGDRLPTGTRDVSVTTSAGPVTDHLQWAGMTLEEKTLLDGAVISTQVTDPWRSSQIASATRDDGSTARAYRTGVKGSTAREKLADGTWRYTQSASSLNQLGNPNWTEHRGEVTGWTGTPVDDVTCTKNTYVDNTSKHILDSVTERTTFTGRCTETATATNVQSAERLFYDGGAHGVAPTKGLLTKAQTLHEWTATGGRTWAETRAGYDNYGRQTSGIDVLGGQTTTTYTPATGVATAVSVTDAEDMTVSAQFDPARGQPVSVTDAAGYTTQGEFDTLGRTTKVWSAGRAKTLTPDAKFAYHYDNDAPNWVRTQTLRDDGNYDTGYTLLDGLLRARQSQTHAVGGGRMITDTIYDTRGLTVSEYGPTWNASAPSATLVGLAPNQVKARTITDFDTAGRAVKSTFLREAEPLWSTETIYHGADLVATVPPSGGTATAVKTDALGRAVEKRDYETFTAARAGSNDASTFEATTYTYTPRDELASVTAPGGARWTFGYDLPGNQTRVSDPDAGVSTATFDEAGQQITSTDARGRTLAYVYDGIGRNTEIRSGSTTGAVLVRNVFDTLKPGLPTSSTRYSDGHAYTTATTGYDDRGRATGSKITIPAVEGALAGPYEYSIEAHSLTGNVLRERVPGGGGIGTEIIDRSYTPDGLPYAGKAHNVGSANERHFVSSTAYTVYGELSEIVRGNPDANKRVQTVLDYAEGTRRLTRTQVNRETSTGAEVADTRYTYTDAGTITRIADISLDSPSDIQCFDRDWRGRLTTAWTPQTDDCSQEPSVTNMGGAAPYWLEWDYDQHGNRTTETQHDTTGATTRTFEHPAVSESGGGQPHTTSRLVELLPSGSQVQSTFGYDAAGNTTSRQIDGDTQTIDYDHFGRVDTITEANGDTTEYVYDTSGGRLIVREPDATTLYLPGLELRLPTGSSTPQGTRTYDHGGAAVAQVSPSGPHYLLGDHQGTGQLAIDIRDLTVTRRYQTPYGDLRGSEQPTFGNGWPNTRGFVGGYNDETTGLTHIGARHYDDVLGSFISIDPLIDYTDPVQMHGYNYANQDPITRSDPTGAWQQCGCQDDTTTEHTLAKEPKRKRRSTSGPGGGGGGGRPGTANRGGSSLPPFPKSTGRLAELPRGKAQLDALIRQWDYLDYSHPEDRDALKSAICARYEVSFICGDATTSYADAPGLTFGEALRNLGKIAYHLSAVSDGVECYGGDALSCATMIPVLKWLKVVRLGDAANDGRKATKDSGEPPVEVCPRSLPPGTQVLMADGTHKPIENIELGDKVLATDPETGKTQPRKVTATWINEGRKTLIDITINNNDSDGDSGKAGTGDRGGKGASADDSDTDTLVATHNHPFWAPDLKEWVSATELQAGAWLQTSTGTWTQVTAVNKLEAQHQRVHNLTVADDHTYHISRGSLLVQNCPKRNPAGTPADRKFAKKVRLAPDSPSVVHRGMSVREFVSKHRHAKVLRELPGEFLDGTVEDALRSGNSTVRKLLTDGRWAR